MRNLLFTVFVLFQILILQTESGFATDKMPEPFRILPQPHKTELLIGDGLVFGQLKNLKITGEFERPVMGEILSLLAELDSADKGLLLLKIDNSGIAPESKEGYVLTIANGNVEIISGGEAGIFYGCQTLEQLLEDSRDFNTPIPACKITDYPDYIYRAVHIDVKHHLDHLNTYYESIDRLARYKINAITFEFEDKLRYRRQPLVGAPQAISIDEMAALTKYARKRHIEITPLVQGLGHATFILKHEEYKHLRELPDNRWAFCPMDEGTYDVLFDLYLDAIEATPGSRYFHIGGDEIGNIGLCDRCKPTADEKGTFELNLYWFNRVCDFLIEHGRIPIFWDDMPFQYAGVWTSTRDEKDYPELWEKAEDKLNEVIERFPEKGVFMHWNYSTCRQPGNERAIKWLTDNNVNTMVSTAVQSSEASLFPFDDRTGKASDRGIVAIQSSLNLAFEKGITGMLSTAWDDRSVHQETLRRGFGASAEYSWNTSGRNLDEFQKSYMQREFGPDASYTDLYLQLRSAALFWETSLLQNGNRMDSKNALFELPGLAHWVLETKKEKKDYTKLLIDLPNLSNIGEWTKKYEPRLKEAEKQYEIYKNTSTQLDELYKVSIRNRYHWEVYSALNNFQITAPELLLALKMCDVKDENKREVGFKSVDKAIDNFNNAWANLQSVYAETRFVTYPSDYVPDRYYHFASQREDLTWMIQVEELVHPIVKKWVAGNRK